MEMKLTVYNTLTRKKELFEPINPPFVGLYVCGPTVYSDSHLGHARSAITWDLLYRYLIHMGYRVRYVRNITDVGHLENEAEESGEDKISKKARLEKLEPMEVVQYYTNRFHDKMHQLNTLDPNIEPHASGHIIEQQILIEKIIESGFAYEIDGSVYFDVEKYNNKHHYGKLSGRKIEDLLSNTRELDGQSEKRNQLDFALWKKANPEHIMQWPSKWSDGFPGWHLECTAMGNKYLGTTFDIHGGGMDLLFPHHECEIAQSVAGNGVDHVKYWMHNNMITIEGQKMARSLNNFITLDQMFAGDHPKLEKAYSPMTIRFFMLQAHYRSTLDFSNEALQASEKGLKKLFEGMEAMEKIQASPTSSINIEEWKGKLYDAMNDDLNSPVLIAHLFDGIKMINLLLEGRETINEQNLKSLKILFGIFVHEILGLEAEEKGNNDELTSKLIETMIKIRQDAKHRKDFATADSIRNELNAMGIELRDTKDGAEWKLK
ncbi:MAG: cysteine--tRNA ligase [Bacteroidales bacterium]|nr:cysteine--tRNA ligase [Bacteroidales bacterium]